MIQNKLGNYILSNEKKMKLPLFFNHLTEVKLNHDAQRYDVRVVPSLFYNTKNRLLPYPIKTII